MEDGEELEVLESGTQSELAEAHRTMTAPPRSPSGHPNVYGTVPYAFPAAIQLDGLGPISDALVGRKKWEDPEVQLELDENFLNPNVTLQSINRYI